MPPVAAPDVVGAFSVLQAASASRSDQQRNRGEKAMVFWDQVWEQSDVELLSTPGPAIIQVSDDESRRPGTEFLVDG